MFTDEYWLPNSDRPLGRPEGNVKIVVITKG